MQFFERDILAYAKYVEKNFPNSPTRNQNELKKPLKRIFTCIKIIRLFSRINIDLQRKAIFDDLLQSVFDILFSLAAYSHFNFNASLRSFSEQLMICVVGLENNFCELSNNDLSKKSHSALWDNYIKESTIYDVPMNKSALDDVNEIFAHGSQVLHRDPCITDKNNFDFLNEYLRDIEHKQVLHTASQINKVNTAVQVLIFDRYMKNIDYNQLTMPQKSEFDDIKSAITFLK